MKVSLNWIREYTDINVSTDELIKLATERLGGVEGVTDMSKHYEGIVVAKVVSCVKHPNADKLNLCKVDDGGVVTDVARDENGYVQVVCGAPNVREGLLVAWIPPGATVPLSYGEKELFVLEARDLRGELSNGMLASPRELGLNDDHVGILEIDETVQRGTPLVELYNLNDTIIEIENKMFTHRPDCFGQLGVAREIAGIQQIPFHSPDWYVSAKTIEGGINESVKRFDVSVQDSGLCPRYMGVVLEGIKVKPSPIWLQSYLKRLGVRPINNIVDITNYIMLLTAQPLHAFDFDKVAVNGELDVSVRRPTAGEKMTLLDGKEIEPHKDATLICNANGPIALGGVMGGGNSEVDEQTTRIVLECATFDMYNIRKTSMIHGLFTDAVTRFNKGQPAAQLPAVLGKAVEMFGEIADAKPVGKPVDVYDSNQESVEQPYIEVTADFINERLGSKFTTESIVELLNNVELAAHEASGPISVTVPFWRTDIEIPEDIVEEVGRLHGFDQLPVSLPTRSIEPVAPHPRLALKQQIRQILSRAGANEVLTYSFVHGDLLKKVGQKTEDSYAIRNALSPDLQYYRQTLTPSLLELVHSNIKAGCDQFALFEINKAHNKVHTVDEEGLPAEQNFVALTFADGKKTSGAYFAARRYLDYLMSNFGITLSYSTMQEDPGYPVTAPFDHARSALVTVKELDIFLGIIGEYKSSVTTDLKLPQHAAGFEIGLDAILEAVSKIDSVQYKPLSRYPSTTQDITLKVANSIQFATLEDCIIEELKKSEYTWQLTPVGIYQKEPDTKNISLQLTCSHDERTLSTKEVNTLVSQITWQAGEKLGAQQV